MSKYRSVFFGIGVLIGIYFVATVLVSPNPAVLERFNLTATTVRIINLTFAVVYAIIWLIAATGYVRIREYSQLIRKNKDGKGFALIASGLGFLALRMPISSTVNAIFVYFGRQHEWLQPIGVISNNYLGLILALAGFSLIGLGVGSLLELVPAKLPRRNSIIMLIVSMVLVSAYTYLAIGQPGFDTPLQPGQRATYYLPSWLIVSTIILPYAYIWYHGFMAAISLRHYRKNVKGTLYKQGLRWLTWGISIVIIGSIILQFSGARLITGSRFQVQPLIVAAYIWFLIVAAGYSCIAMGARRLKKIEEV